ncbi:MAG: ABC transporter permease subunit [Chitinivibrionales bacterium]|nr:ABC transporter permease subunit [Chitinivibrionales bacterium]
MNAIFQIAINTFKETIRNKVLYNILFFAIGLIFLSISFGEWSVFARVQVMQDFGLATMSIAGLLLAVFIGVGLLAKEIADKTLYSTLVKPIFRYTFVSGKFFGLLVTLAVNFAILTLIFWVIIIYLGGQATMPLFSAVLLIWIETALIVSVSIFFSTITTPMLAAIFTLAFYVIGHMNDFMELTLTAQTSINPVIENLLKIIYYLLPNLEHFNIREQVVYSVGVAPNYILFSFIYGVLYIFLFLILSCLIFTTKDL